MTSESDIAAYLEAHPDFLRRHPALVERLSPPKRELGGGVIDFQQFMVKNLQESSKNLQHKYDLLVEFCRENLSVQAQVHHAVLRLVRARSLEQLLEAVALDLVSLFDVDVVRLGIESPAAELYQLNYAETRHSGIVFIPPGTVQAVLGAQRKVLLLADAEATVPEGFEELFADCGDLVRSAAFLSLDLEQTGRPALLAFGVRYPERFHPGQGVELLHFLAQIVAHQLDGHLSDVALAEQLGPFAR